MTASKTPTRTIGHRPGRQRKKYLSVSIRSHKRTQDVAIHELIAHTATLWLIKKNYLNRSITGL